MIIETSGKSKRAIQDGFAALEERGVLTNSASKQKPVRVIGNGFDFYHD